MGRRRARRRGSPRGALSPPRRRRCRSVPFAVAVAGGSHALSFARRASALDEHPLERAAAELPLPAGRPPRRYGAGVGPAPQRVLADLEELGRGGHAQPGSAVRCARLSFCLHGASIGRTASFLDHLSTADGPRDHARVDAASASRVSSEHVFASVPRGATPAGTSAEEDSVMLDELNPEQLAAAQHGDGPLLIVAGAGTGKTATLVHRVAYLIGRGADPRRILLLTFTRRAAAEMLRRVEAVLAATRRRQGRRLRARLGRHLPRHRRPAAAHPRPRHRHGSPTSRSSTAATRRTSCTSPARPSASAAAARASRRSPPASTCTRAASTRSCR